MYKNTKSNRLLLKIILLLLITLNLVKTGIITPDPYFPLLINRPNREIGGQSIIAKFKLSSGLLYGQNIALIFPEALTNYLKFTGETDPYQCTLQDTTLKSYKIASKINSATNANCQYMETVTPLVINQTYILTITLNAKLFLFKSSIIPIGIFTSYSSKFDGNMIIDSNLAFADIGLYNSSKSVLYTKMLTINSLNIEKIPLRLFSKFNIKINLKVLQVIYSSSMRIVFGFPVEIDVSSLSITCDSVKSANGLQVKQLKTNYLLVEGIDEDVAPNQSITCNIQNLNAAKTVTDGLVEAMVYYKNSYSEISYDFQKFINVFPNTINNFTAAHPDGWESYQGTASPVVFRFSLSNDITNSAYVAIRQTNTLWGSRKANFVASTCDFTNYSVSNELGVRPKCFPFVNDMNFVNPSSSSEFSGSGIVFKLPGPILASKTIEVMVFIFNESCGNSQLLNASNNNYNSVNFKFDINVYSSIDMSESNEKRFNPNNIIASGIPIIISTPCYNSVTVATIIADTDYPADNNSDKILLRDITDFRFSRIMTSYSAECSKCFLNGLNASNNSPWVDGALNNPQISSDLSSSYFALQTQFTIESNKHPRNYLSLPLYGTTTLQKGRLSTKFSKTILKRGNKYCYLTWGLSAGTFNSQSQLLNTASPEQNPSTSGQFNIIASQVAPVAPEYLFDTSVANPDDLKFYSKYNDMTAQTPSFKFIANNQFSPAPNTWPTKGTFAFFTDCVQVNKDYGIKSVFDYVEFNLIHEKSENNGVDYKINRINRFFKFASTLGYVDPASTYTATTGVTFHTVSFPKPTLTAPNVPSLSTNAVCLLQIDMTDLNEAKGGNSNILAVYINFMNIIDVDYTDISSTYPISLDDSYQAYSFPTSAFTMGINDGAFKNSFNIQKYPSVNNPNSIYLQFLSNLILIKTPTVNLTNDILIPVYCPLQNTANTEPYYNPTVTLQWLNSDNGNQIINKINKTLIKSSTTYFTPSDSLQNKLLSTTNSPIITNLRFAPYTTSNDYKLYLFANPGTPENNNAPTSITQAYNCSGFSLFMKKVIKIDNTTSDPGLFMASLTNGYTYSSKDKLFYIRGKAFSQGYFVALKNPKVFPLNPTTALNSVYFNAIKRPNLEELAVKNNFTSALSSTGSVGDFIFPTNDIAAFYCTSSGTTSPDDSNYFTNFSSDVTINGKGVFLLDWNPDNNSDWLIASIQADKTTEVLYKADVAGNFKINLQVPITVNSLANGLVLRVFTAQFTPQTICGIINVFGNTNQCINTPGVTNSIDCVIPSSNTQISVCCYNVNTNIDPFPFPATSIVVPTYNDITNIFNKTWGYILKLKTTSQWVTKNADGTILYGEGAKDNSFAKFTSISYEQTLQTGAFAKAVITVALPREAVRNSKLVIIGDFSKLAIKDIKPTCMASLGDKLESGNFMIDGCSLKFPTGEAITVYTKSLIYKCGASFSSSMIIKIWPVNVFAFASTSGNFLLPYYLNDNLTAITNDKSATPLTYSGAALNTVAPVIQNNFCQLKSIFPVVANEIAEYKFSLDILSAYNTAVKDKPINEVMIFFPFSIFSSLMNAIKSLTCLIDTTVVQCNVVDDNMLFITLIAKPSNSTMEIPLTNRPSNNINISVQGIVNNAQLKLTEPFICSVNNFDSGKRTQIINGNGFLNIPIKDPTTNNGYLSLYSVTTEDINPRGLTNVNLSVTYDSAVTLVSSDKDDPSNLKIPLGGNSIQNKPFFILTVPDDFMLNSNTVKLYNTTIGISEQFYSDLITKQISNVDYTTEILDIISNRICINIKLDTALNNTLSLQKNFRNWKIKINNLVAPNQEISSTGRFRVTLTNSDYSTLFRTYSNLNNVANRLLSQPADPNGWIIYTNGVGYTFTARKWIIDIVSLVADDNTILIKPGRFLKYTFRVRNVDFLKAPVPSMAMLALEDSIFSTDKKSYNIITAIGFVDFYIGAACKTQMGSYIINFKINNLQDFFQLSPIQITVDNSIGSITSPGNLLDVVRAGSQSIKLTLSEPTFASFNITYTQADGTAKNDPTAIISPFLFNKMSSTAYSQFSISTLTTVGFQYFKAVNSNTCYKMDFNVLTYNINAENNDFPTDYNLSNYFTYSNQNRVGKKNSVRFTFKPNIAPIFIYCALVCTNLQYPTNDFIFSKATSTTDQSLPQMSYYFNYIPVSSVSYDIVFNNLVRGGLYDLKCFAKTTLTNNYNTVNLTMENYPPPNGDILIKVADYLPTHCLKFSFLNDIGDDSRNSILKYCQSKFVGYQGCIICIDLLGNTIKGMKLSNGYQCQTGYLYNKNDDTSNRLLDYVLPAVDNTPTQDGFSFNNKLAGFSTYFYTVCAVQDLLCDDDLNYPTTLTDVMRSIMLDLKDGVGFNSNLNITGVFLNRVDLIIDLTPPDISNITDYISNNITKKDGNFKIDLTYPDKDLLCYWGISDDGNNPIMYDLVNCVDKGRCGKVRLSTISSSITTMWPTPFIVNTYYIYIGCYNNIPNAQQASDVLLLFTFNIGS